MKNIHIVYGPTMSGKTLNAESIRKILLCDKVFDHDQQDQIREAQKAGLQVLVLSTEQEPKTNKGYRNLFNGAICTHVEVFKTLLGVGWNDGSAQTTTATFIVIRRVSLFHQGWSFKKPVYVGKHLLEFNSREEAKKWINEHPFTGDPNDVIKHVKYQIVANNQNF
jgi:flavodoxin